MSKKVCEDCGCTIYNLGCVNCNEIEYIEEQAYLDSLPAVYEMPKPDHAPRFEKIVPEKKP